MGSQNQTQNNSKSHKHRDHSQSHSNQNQLSNNDKFAPHWRSAQQVHDRLEGSQPWLVGDGSHIRRVRSRIYQDSTPQIAFPEFLPLSSPSHSDGQRSAGTSQERSYRDMCKFRWFLQPSVCGPEKGWRMASNHQPEGSEPLLQHSALQNGEYLYSERYSEARRLHGKDRLKGCIFQCENSPFSQEIPEISLERNLLSVQSSPIRLSNCSESFLQDHAGSSKASPTEGNKASPVSRRYFDSSTLTVPTETPYQHGCGQPESTWFCPQREEMHLHTYTSDRIPRPSCEFRPDEDLPSRKESQRYRKGVPKTREIEDSVSTHSSSSDWQNDSCNTSSVSSSSSLSSSPTPEEQNNLEKTKQLLGSGCSGQGIESRSLVVDFPTIGTQWENADDTNGKSDHRIRRLHPRLGCVLSGAESRRTVADDGKESAYQSAGVEISFPGITDIRIQQSQVAHFDADRQQDSDSIHQPERRNTLQTPLRPGMQGMELVSEERVNSTSGAHCRRGQHPSRLRVTSLSGSMRLDAIQGSVS